MNKKLYFKYFLLLLITLNIINVYSFNQSNNKIIKLLVIKNENICQYSHKITISYIDYLNKTNNLQKLSLYNNTKKI